MKRFTSVSNRLKSDGLNPYPLFLRNKKVEYNVVDLYALFLGMFCEEVTFENHNLEREWSACVASER